MTWAKQQIRKARQLPLVKILPLRSYIIQPVTDGNYVVVKMPGVIIKNNYWYDQSKRVGGNTIDFFIKVENRSFFETMQILEHYL